jgi:hypothetical protein
MYIITKTAYEDGSRPPLQTWDEAKPPEGYAFCPDEFYSVFYSTIPAGFVNITVSGDTVKSMTVNRAAYDAFIAANPGADTPSEPAEPEPTADEILNALLGV